MVASSLPAPLLAPTATQIRVASVPSSHVYVRHLSPPDGLDDGVLRLPEPRAGGESPQSPWWPPVMLEADWVRRHHDEFDVFHIHFGFDARTPQQLIELVDVLDAHRKPLVLTVHDLRNPHHAAREAHDAQLDVLVPAAHGLITLTNGAAAEILDRWGRWATVVPHPHVVEPDQIARLRARRRLGEAAPARVGLHLKSARAGMDPYRVVPALARAAEEIGDVVLQINGHKELLEPSGSRFDRDLVDLLRAHGDSVDLRIHDYFSDDELWTYLASLDVSVLPYRFGTHSGWLEACRDLGTAVVAPSCGYYSDQGPVETYLMDEDVFDERSLTEAVRRAVSRAPEPITIAERERQRLDIALAHRRVYESILGAR